MSHIRSRFNKAPDELVIKYTSSLSFDWKLYPYDIAGSIAHAEMLAKQNIISKDECLAITDGLKAIKQEIKQGEFEFHAEMEDIHMAIEKRLFELIGEPAGKLHTARSRNDQIALDMRLYIKEVITETLKAVRNLQEALVKQAELNEDAVVSGYTHMQSAQPVLLAHHLLAYYEMFKRDKKRFENCLELADVLPLGSGAMAGTSYNTDREFLAKKLGFSSVSRNSMDAVCDRDFMLDYLSAASICMMHISRLAEELVIWSSQEFGFVTIDDAYATGSSIMPQKKNPDVAELGRGKTGRVYGNLMALLSTMKSLPLTYNRDLQEDKEGLFDTVETIIASLHVFSGMVDTLTFNKEKMKASVTRGFILATDVADYLAKKGVPFRTAHGVTAKLVAYADEAGKKLEELSLEEYQKFSEYFNSDITKITIDTSIASRDNIGGTAHKRVAEELKTAKQDLKN